MRQLLLSVLAGLLAYLVMSADGLLQGVLILAFGFVSFMLGRE